MCFICCSLKEKDVRKKETVNVYMWNQYYYYYYYYFDLLKVRVGSLQQKIKLLSPYIIFKMPHFTFSIHWTTKVYYLNKKKVVAVLGFEVYEVFYQQ